MFIDRATIFVRAGDGGNGAVSFHRECEIFTDAGRYTDILCICVRELLIRQAGKLSDLFLIQRLIINPDIVDYTADSFAIGISGISDHKFSCVRILCNRCSRDCSRRESAAVQVNHHFSGFTVKKENADLYAVFALDTGKLCSQMLPLCLIGWFCRSAGKNERQGKQKKKDPHLKISS